MLEKAVFSISVREKIDQKISDIFESSCYGCLLSKLIEKLGTKIKDLKVAKVFEIPKQTRFLRIFCRKNNQKLSDSNQIQMRDGKSHLGKPVHF